MSDFDHGQLLPISTVFMNSPGQMDTVARCVAAKAGHYIGAPKARNDGELDLKAARITSAPVKEFLGPVVHTCFVVVHSKEELVQGADR